MKHIGLLFTLLLVAFASRAETIILEYDPSCMDMYEYRNPSGSIRLLSFSPHTLSATERVVLEAGAGEGQRLSSRPRLLTECGSLTIALRLVQRINDRSTELYIARPDGKGYVLYRINKAYYYFPKGGQIEFYGADTHFRFDPSAPSSGRDLALPDSRTSVWFTGRTSYGCFSGYAFRKTSRSNRSVVKEFRLVPEIGIVEKAGGNAQYGLKLVNGAIFDHFLQERCAVQQANAYGRMSTGAAEPAPTTYGQPAQPAAEAPVHVVQPGETLYGIARKYGIDLQDFIRWNGLSSHVIKPGMQLVLAPPPASQPAAPPRPGHEARYTARGVQTQTTHTPQPPQAATTAAPEVPAWVNPPAYHIVQPGETVAQIAEKYGYTEARFRWMNDLDPDMHIYPGMRLRTTDCQLLAAPAPSQNDQRPKGGGYRTEPVPYEQVPVMAQPTATPQMDYTKFRIHIVGEGETLYEIATRYDMTLEELLEINNLRKGEVLLPGQRLYVKQGR